MVRMIIVIIAGSSNRSMRAEAWGYTCFKAVHFFDRKFLPCSPRYIIHFFAFFTNLEKAQFALNERSKAARA
jgi:hypothetical protein